MGAVADTAGGTGAGTGPASDAVRDWEAVRAHADIQYAPIPMPEPPKFPGWLEALGRFLAELFRPVAQALGVSWPVLQWILVGIAVVILAWLLWGLLAPIARIRLARKQHAAEEEAQSWAPDREDALALLEDADRLAGEGRYDEATHLLLRRSVGQIAEARPDWLGPASTAREIAALPALPERARGAFSTIAARVERSLFALRHLTQDDWQAARAAYADFALADFSAAPA